MSTDEKSSKLGWSNNEVWSSRIAFYFAAIGAAVGFGNVWRFPALSYSYGGGAFFIPYLLALFLIGIPILVLEIAFGQFWQTGDAGVFGHFHRRLTGVGVSSIACGYIVVTYYSMLIAWVINAFFDSFSDDAPWTDPGINGTVATGYFFNNIIGMSTITDENVDKLPTRLVGKNVGYSFLVWFLVFLCLAFGVKWTGRITYFTMGFPIVLLFVFLGKSVSLEGAEDGIEAYIGVWDMSVLSEKGDVWSTAVSQIFFSIGVTFGIMTAFGAHCPKNEPVFMNSFVIALSNSMFSFISGFAVFSALGHLAFLEETTIDKLSIGGFSLVFGTWPVVLGTLPGGIHWVRLLFFNLFLLGLDSAFALLEATITVVCNIEALKGVPKWAITAGFCMLAFLLSIMYASDAGLYFLDTVDYYVNFVMILVGFFETFGAGWMYGIDDHVQTLGAKAVWTYIGANFGAVILACGLWFGIDNSNAIWAGFVGLIVFYLLGITVTHFFLAQKIKEEPERWSVTSIWWELAFGNIFRLRDLIQPVVGFIPGIWCLLVKQILPHLLIILFVNLAQTKNDDGKSKFGHYGGYATEPYQVLGILCVVFALALFLIGVLFPSIFSALNTLPAADAESSVEEVVDEKNEVEKPQDVDIVVEEEEVHA